MKASGAHAAGWFTQPAQPTLPAVDLVGQQSFEAGRLIVRYSPGQRLDDNLIGSVHRPGGETLHHGNAGNDHLLPAHLLQQASHYCQAISGAQRERRQPRLKAQPVWAREVLEPKALPEHSQMLGSCRLPARKPGDSLRRDLNLISDEGEQRERDDFSAT